MKYNPALDGIRALAVMAVVAGHCRMPHATAGQAGVDVFFVLSGFLITSLLRAQAEGTGIQLGAFYLRRARRLYPALMLMLALYLATFPFMYAGPHARDALWAALYLTDYTSAYTGHPDIIGHTWSLSVEEHFYLLWPLAMLGLTQIRTRRFVVYLLASAWVAATVWRMRVHTQFDMGADWAYYRFDTRASGLLLGALLAYLPELRHRAWVLALPVFGWLLWYSTGGHRIWLITPAELLGAAAVLWAASGAAWPLAWKPLAHIGRISYGIYLFHYPLAWFLRNAQCLWWQNLAITVVASVTLAHFSYVYWESRFLQRRVSAPGPAVPKVAALG